MSQANTLSELPRYAALRFGDKIGLYAKGQEFSFADLETRITALAGGLARLGLRNVSRGIAIGKNKSRRWA